MTKRTSAIGEKLDSSDEINTLSQNIYNDDDSFKTLEQFIMFEMNDNKNNLNLEIINNIKNLRADTDIAKNEVKIGSLGFTILSALADMYMAKHKNDGIIGDNFLSDIFDEILHPRDILNNYKEITGYNIPSATKIGVEKYIELYTQSKKDTDESKVGGFIVANFSNLIKNANDNFPSIKNKIKRIKNGAGLLERSGADTIVAGTAATTGAMLGGPIGGVIGGTSAIAASAFSKTNVNLTSMKGIGQTVGGAVVNMGTTISNIAKDISGVSSGGKWTDPFTNGASTVKQWGTDFYTEVKKKVGGSNLAAGGISLVSAILASYLGVRLLQGGKKIMGGVGDLSKGWMKKNKGKSSAIGMLIAFMGYQYLSNSNKNNSEKKPDQYNKIANDFQDIYNPSGRDLAWNNTKKEMQTFFKRFNAGENLHKYESSLTPIDGLKELSRHTKIQLGLYRYLIKVKKKKKSDTNIELLKEKIKKDSAVIPFGGFSDTELKEILKDVLK